MVEERVALRIAALGVGQFGIVVAFQAVAVVLPAVGSGLDLAPDLLQWLVGSTALTYAGGLLVAGRLADRFGARRMLITGSLVLVAFSGWAAAAPDVIALIAARAGQGVGMALYTPAMIALLSTGFAEEAQRHRALTWWNVAGGAGGFVAVIAAGWVAQYSWRAAFVLLAIPPLLTAVLVALAFPPRRSEAAPPRRVSLINASLPPLAATLIILGVTGPNETLHTRIPLLAGAAVLIMIWLIRERRDRHPLVTPDLRTWPALQPIMIAILHAAAINTPIFFYGLFLQTYRGATTFEVGLGYLPANVGLVLGSVIGGAAVRLRGRRFTIAAGMATVGVSVLLLATVNEASTVWHPFLLGWLLFGLGASAAQIGFIGLVGGLPSAAAGTVAGLLTAGGQLGTAIGLALFVGLAATAEDAVVGYRLGFAGAAIAAALGVVAGLATVGRARDGRRERDRTAVGEH